MPTINISLLEKLNKQVNSIVKKEGLASKSEFFRAMIRIYTFLKENTYEATTPSVLSEKPLEHYKAIPLSRVEKEIRRTNQYNEAFIKSVIAGLKKSSVYAN